MDFFIPSKKVIKGITHVGPKFKTTRSKDLMIRGRDFYAIYDESTGLWSRDQDTAIRLIDSEIKNYILEHKSDDEPYVGDYMWDSDSGVIDKWIRYTEKQLKDNYVPLDNRIIFSNTELKREYYASHRLNYPLQEGPIDAYDELMSTLYDPEERKKLEWAIGAIVSGDSVWIQKFIVIVGDPGTGKSTFFKILRKLFGGNSKKDTGYLATINAKSLGDSRSQFALEPLMNDPLIAIEDDSDLSHITDNTRLNSLISHEPMIVNPKGKKQYENTFRCFIFLGTNKDVKITDSASGLIRRLIDVVPSGRKVTTERYNEIMGLIDFELGGIAYHCLKVYQHNKKKYNDYIPVRTLRATNLIYNFLEENYDELTKENDGCRFLDIWNAYNRYCEFGKIQYSHNRQELRNELRPYFHEFHARYEYQPGVYCKEYFKGFKYDKLGIESPYISKAEPLPEGVSKWLDMNSTSSKFDIFCSECSAQLTNEEGNPKYKWVNVTSLLKDISTTELHYVKVPENHIVIDFDLKDKDGNKSKELNLKAASQFPPTYAEWSKSGSGIHLHYIYKGDVTKLSRVYDDEIEIKIFNGNSSLRRKLSYCNEYDISEISSGLPFKEEKEVSLDEFKLQSEKQIRTMIKRNLNKEYHNNTTCSVQYIKKILDDAYNGDVSYDVRDLKPSILYFASQSTHQSSACISMCKDMKYYSKDNENKAISTTVDIMTPTNEDEKPICIYDIECFQNLFLVCYSPIDSDEVYYLCYYERDPDEEEIMNLYSMYRMGGFNNRGYDAHMMYAAMSGYSLKALYNNSQRIIANDGGKFSEGYRLDYFDIYDYSTKKQSLKKWEIELGEDHVENALDWNKPVPKDRVKDIIEYCCNDVRATKAVFKKTHSDFKVRQLISKMSGLPIIDTNRQHITKFIFGNDKHPNLVYTDLATGVRTYMDGTVDVDNSGVIQSFPGYEFRSDPNNTFEKESYKFDIHAQEHLCTSCRSKYMDEDPSEGGFVYAKTGMYYDVWCFDVAGMHPASLIAMNKFGEYTKRYEAVRNTRLHIKHKEIAEAEQMIAELINDAELAHEFFNDPELTVKDISNALKLILNSTYGFGAAKFDNPFRDPRDIDNTVAKRGALFMITLKNEVIKRGFEVIHCKTDSIKVVKPTDELKEFIFEFGRKYGYEFEVEHVFKKICLVNRSTYIGQYDTGEWDATGAEFAHPYIFKTLFTHEPIEFDDYNEVKSAQVGALYLDFNEDPEYIEELEKEKKKLEKKGEFTGRYEEIVEKLKELHNYIFVGRVGGFVPVTQDGGELMVKRGDTYSSVSGTKGYRWLETTTVKSCGKENIIDISYYDKLVEDAEASIGLYGWVDTFCNSDEDAAYPF